jgi:hypothetical protein
VDRAVISAVATDAEVGACGRNQCSDLRKDEPFG